MLSVLSERDEEMEKKDEKLNEEINKVLGIDEEIVEKPDEDMEIEYKFYRLEKLVERRPLLLKIA